MRNKLFRVLQFMIILLASFYCTAASSSREAERSSTDENLNVVLIHNFDEDTQGWIYSDGLEVSMNWDPHEGSPKPGSLRLSLVQPLPNTQVFTAYSPCMEAASGEMWRLDAKVRKTGDGHCVPFVIQYESPECTGEGSNIGNTSGIEPNIWHHRTGGIQSFPFTQSVRIAAAIFVPSLNKTMDCHFDSMVLSNNRAPAAAEIPSLSPLGLLGLGSLLGLTALALLAGRSQR